MKQRLWLPAGLWIAGILLLVPTGRMFNELFRRAIGREGLRWLLLAAGAVVVAHALRALIRTLSELHPARAALGLLCVVGFIASLLRSPIPEEILHPLQYGPLALLLERALSRGPKAWPRAGLVLAICGCVALADELLQYVTPGRRFDSMDIKYDVLSAALPLAFLRATGLELSADDEGRADGPAEAS